MLFSRRNSRRCICLCRMVTRTSCCCGCVAQLTGDSGVCLRSRNAMTADKNYFFFPFLLTNQQFFNENMFDFSLIKTSECNLDLLSSTLLSYRMNSDTHFASRMAPSGFHAALSGGYMYVAARFHSRLSASKLCWHVSALDGTVRTAVGSLLDSRIVSDQLSTLPLPLRDIAPSDSLRELELDPGPTPLRARRRDSEVQSRQRSQMVTLRHVSGWVSIPDEHSLAQC